MKANKLTPRHAAPVQREINTTSSVGGTGLTPLWGCYWSAVNGEPCQHDPSNPFAGDDAE